MTEPTKEKLPAVPREEYPRPRFVREEWLNLNGVWNFSFDDGDAGLRQHWEQYGLPEPGAILVPFAYETPCSGIGERALHDIVWYERSFAVPAAWEGMDILLHIGAADYSARLWVNGRFAVSHEGGHTPFTADITLLLDSGAENRITVRVQDYAKDVTLPRGKQYWEENSKSIFYTGTTGIWQTVWLEPVPAQRLESVAFTPDIDRSQVEVALRIAGLPYAGELRLRMRLYYTGSDAERSYDGEPAGECELRVTAEDETCCVGLHSFNHAGFERWWSPERPNLYEARFTLLRDGVPTDEVTSYFGMRKVSIENGVLNLNNKPYFMRLVLDQGYFPQGGLTAPDDEAFRNDILLAKQMGFNGARKHQKVEDPRWLYWCDRLGFLVWGEMANAYDYSRRYAERFQAEWAQVIRRDYSHPCIVAWVPINESWGVPNIKADVFQQNHVRAVYYLTKSLDATRPVQSNDGWEHVRSDLCTLHDYEPNRKVLEKRYASLEETLRFYPAGRALFEGGDAYTGEPVLVTEFGGIAYLCGGEGWGYSGAESGEDFLRRLRDVVDPLLDSSIVQGFCYTQLSDVEQEMNGLLTAERKPKVAIESLSEVFGRSRALK